MPSSNDGQWLTSAKIVTAISGASVTSAYSDITGLAISPTIGSKGVVLQLRIPMLQGIGAATYLASVYDVTAAAPIGGCSVTLTAGGFGDIALDVPVSPAAGARNYKAQIRANTTTTYSIYVQDPTVTSVPMVPYLACVQQ